MTEAGQLAFQRLTITAGIIAVMVNIGQAPASDVTIADIMAASEEWLDFWGYAKLADQIGDEEAFIVASMVENSTYPDLIRAIITVESAWDARARSCRDAIGLMQIRMIAANEYISDITEEELFDPLINVDVGIRIFEQHMNFFGDYSDAEQWALTSYNRGRAGTFSLNRIPPITDYSQKVIDLTGQM